MTDQPPLPPLPPQDPQVIPPAPPQVLPYAQAGEERPGILTAVAVLSIVFGGLGSLTNLCGVGQSIGYVFMSQLSANVTATGPATAPPNVFANMPVTPFVVNAILSLVSLALAVYLIACGAVVLRSRLAGRKHHLRYATLKFIFAVPVALGSAWSTYAMQSAFMASMPTPAGSGSSVTFVGAPAALISVVTAGLWLAVSLAYPVALVIVMRLRQVRNYYARLEEVGRY